MATTTTTTLSSSALAHVLTDAPLLQLVTSFQRGVPWAAVPLLRRYRADGRVTFDLARGTFSNAQLQDCRALDEWAVHTMGEAIVFYGDFDALRTVWRQWGSTHGAPDDRVQLHGRLCEAACMFGRLDMLQWLYDTQRDVVMETSRTSINVYTSTVHGQLHVLEWLVERFPAHARAVLRAVNCTEVVRGGHAAMLRWLLPRQLGRFPPDAMSIACEHGHLEVLQLLIAYTLMVPRPLLDKLLDKAAIAGHVRVVEWLATEKHARYNMLLVARVLARGHVDVADFLLTHRHAYTPPIEGALDASAVEMVLHAKQLQALAFLIRVRDREKLPLSVRVCTRMRHSLDALQLLLPISSDAEVMRTLVELSVRELAGVSVAYLQTRHSFPAPVVAFVERNERRALGALPAMICAATKDGDVSAPSSLVQNAELARAAAEAGAAQVAAAVRPSDQGRWREQARDRGATRDLRAAPLRSRCCPAPRARRKTRDGAMKRRVTVPMCPFMISSCFPNFTYFSRLPRLSDRARLRHAPAPRDFSSSTDIVHRCVFIQSSEFRNIISQSYVLIGVV